MATQWLLNSKTRSAIYCISAIAAPVALLYVWDAWVWLLDLIEATTGKNGGDIIPAYFCIGTALWLLAARKISQMTKAGPTK